MKVLVIMHDAGEGPATLGEFLEQGGVELEYAKLYEGDRLPGLADLEAVVSMGGPMNVYEDHLYPFLLEETDFLVRAVAAGLPVLGICLGAQMIAKACGAPVTRSPVKELGFSEVFLTAAGQRDPLFQGLPEKLKVFQWHEDMFYVPHGGRLLATGRECPHQAFRIKNAVGLQFHLEINADLLADWFSYSRKRFHFLHRFRELELDLTAQAQRFYCNFLSWIRGESRSEFNAAKVRAEKETRSAPLHVQERWEGQ